MQARSADAEPSTLKGADQGPGVIGFMGFDLPEAVGVAPWREAAGRNGGILFYLHPLGVTCRARFGSGQPAHHLQVAIPQLRHREVIQFRFP